MRGNGGTVTGFLAHPGELRALSLACGTSTGLAQLLSGLTGLESLALPALRVVAGSKLDCLSSLTSLTGADVPDAQLLFHYAMMCLFGACRHRALHCSYLPSSTSHL